jgi:translation initiation factor 3 subunit M
MSATFVDVTGEAEQFADLFSYLASLKPELKGDADEKNIEKGVEQNKQGELLKKLLSHQQLVLEQGAEKDVEGFFGLQTTLILKHGGSSTKDLLHQQVKAIAANPKEKSLVKITVLNNMYNLAQDADLRAEIFVSLLKCAESNSDLVYPLFDTVEDKFREWKSSVAQKREVYKLLREMTREKETAFYNKFSLKYFKTFEANEVATVTGEAKAYALEVLKSKDNYQYDELFSLAVVKALEKSDASVFQLLKIFNNGDLDNFASFSQSEVSALGLDSDVLRRKISMLTLISLANQKSELSYAEVIKALKLQNEDEVEYWVITAVGEKLLEAKMDPTAKTITVARSSHRSFDKAQWEGLRDRVALWKENLVSVLKVIQSAKNDKQIA